MVGSNYQKWVSKLMGFNFDIQYRPGASNRMADALSRIENQLECNTISMGFWKFWDQLKEEMGWDDFIQKVKVDLEQDAESHKGYSTYQGNLLFKGQLVIPSSTTFLPEILAMYHNSPIGGMRGERKHTCKQQWNCFGLECMPPSWNM